MILQRPDQCTTMPIWSPRYSSAYTDTKERVALLAKYKVDQASVVIIVEFTKAAHLKGQRFCILRSEAQSYPIDSNGKIPCYAVPMSALAGWDSAAEVYGIADSLFNN